MTRRYNTKDAPLDFNIHLNDDGTGDRDGVQIALLADIRRELRKLNELLRCPNFTGMPQTLRQIRANTSRLPRKQKCPTSKS